MDTATERKTRTQYHTNWTTIAVTPLPAGWVTVYDDDERIAIPCPAVLLEEARSETCTTMRPIERDDGNGNLVPAWQRESHTYDLDQPYETRVKAAEFDGSELLPAGDGAHTEWKPNG